MNYPLTPPDPSTPDDWPPPDLGEAMPCKCGCCPDWDWRNAGHKTYVFCLYCPRHCFTSGWEPTIDKAIARWNDEVMEARG